MYSAASREDFESLVTEALNGLPEDLASRMSNVDVVVEDYPSVRLAHPTQEDGQLLLGLYQGIPLPDRGESYFGVLPDRIVLFQGNIEKIARSRSDLRAVVRRTVVHEVAHHFGIDDDRLEELGWA